MRDLRDFTNVEGYLVNLKTGEVFVEKKSKRGRAYLSTITSPRKIKRLMKLAKAAKASDFNQKLAEKLEGQVVAKAEDKTKAKEWFKSHVTIEGLDD